MRFFCFSDQTCHDGIKHGFDGIQFMVRCRFCFVNESVDYGVIAQFGYQPLDHHYGAIGHDHIFPEGTLARGRRGVKAHRPRHPDVFGLPLSAC